MSDKPARTLHTPPIALIGAAALVALAAISVAPAAHALPDEHWSHRGGPRHWFSLAPERAQVRSIGGIGVDTDARPILFLGCRAPGTQDPPFALRGWMALDYDKIHPTLHFVNPDHWPQYLSESLKGAHEWPVTVEWRWRADEADEADPRDALSYGDTLLRERVKYSTDSDYRLRITEEQAEAVLRAPGILTLRITGSGFDVEATYRMSDRTAWFVEACGMPDETWKRTRWREAHERWKHLYED